MTFQDGDIILVKRNKFNTWYTWLLAKLIQFFDGCYYHHAQMYFNGGIWEANKEIELNLVESNNGDNIVVLRLQDPLTVNESGKIQQMLNKYVGDKYDYSGTMSHQLLYLLSLRRIWVGRTGRKARKRMYCTEFVTTIMHDVRGYFPEKHKIGPYKLLSLAPLYYKVSHEGIQ